MANGKGLPSKQHCAYLVAPERVELRTVPVPQPQTGQVLLKIECALAGGTDRKAFARGHPQIPMPGPFGHRYAGTVAALGLDAPAFTVGQPVMGVHSAPCLDCSLCHKELWHLCPDVMKEKVLGAFSEYLCIPARVARQNLFARPDWLTPDHAALLEPLACVVHGLELLSWKGVERVLVLGLGSIGLMFAQLLPEYVKAERAGAGRRAARVELGRCFGLNPVWEVSKASLAEQLPPNEQFDVAIECTGRLEGWKEAFDRTAPGGQCLLFGGIPKGTAFPVDSYRLHYEEVDLLGSFHFSPRDVGKAREFLMSNHLELDPLISGSLPLSRLEEALRKLQTGEGMQYAIEPGT
jgi:L-iditol 2-dehydrogenase